MGCVGNLWETSASELWEHTQSPCLRGSCAFQQGVDDLQIFDWKGLVVFLPNAELNTMREKQTLPVIKCCCPTLDFLVEVMGSSPRSRSTGSSTKLHGAGWGRSKALQVVLPEPFGVLFRVHPLLPEGMLRRTGMKAGVLMP